VAASARDDPAQHPASRDLARQAEALRSQVNGFLQAVRAA
jgi:hypothetical protein